MDLEPAKFLINFKECYRIFFPLRSFIYRKKCGEVVSCQNVWITFQGFGLIGFCFWSTSG